jgi:two-component system, OmpR family, osmolarity sensor histidine kinase EnvZ
LNFLPKKLLSRLVLLIATLLVVSQLVSLKIFDNFEREPRAEALAQEIITIVSFTKAALLAAAPSKRIQLFREINDIGDIKIYDAYPFEPIEPIPDDLFLKLVVKKITAKIPPGNFVVINHYDIPGVWVSFEINGDMFWVVVPRLITDRPFPWHWIGWGMVIAILAISGAYITTKRISRPINNLIEAADKIRNGHSVEKIPLDSVTEFRELSEAFNEMAEVLSKVGKERKFLLASVSHDIRTPLTRIRLASEMLPANSSSLKESLEEDIMEINDILNQFLDFARGFQEEPKVPVNLGKLLKDVQNKHKRMGQTFTLKKKNIRIDIPKKLFIDLRILAFQRCLDNLINNAFSYSKDKVVLEASLLEESFTISIIDNGPGIPENQKSKLLLPFERVDQARGNKGGSGLGLTIADRIVKAHDGKLELINRPEGGLTAKITIPIISA